MKIIITGPRGTLAFSVFEKYSDVIKFITLKGEEIKQIRNILNDISTEKIFILHFAAETNVDLCEKHKLHAINSNYVLTKEIVDQVKDYPNVTLVFTSSASIFDGKKQTFYSENDKSNPVNFYGLTKYLSEEYIKNELSQYYIIRFGWLVGNPFVDNKFIGNIFHKLKTGEKKLFGVNDQFGSVTFADQFSEDLSRIFEQKIDYGTYNYCSDSMITRYELLRRLVNSYHFIQNADVVPISIKNYQPKLIAERPMYELLSNKKAKESGLLTESSFDAAFEKFCGKYKDFFNE